ncbi:MAG: DMT family transporter [Candidatus Poseidoniaceae archaeon]|jgi:drug/metabolite transporter (DMT)-like permease|nr:DMT family transporter [Candidatus Poseidoniaceae archaeon]
MSNSPNTPFWVWGLLVAAVCGVSSAGALFQHVDSVPPLLRASWRLQLTSVVLAPFFVYQWIQQETEIRQKMFERNTVLILLGSGLALALHFGSWVASLDSTSLTHSLLFVTAHPIIIIVGMAILSLFVIGFRSPTRLEILGACIGFFGAAITLLDQGSQQGDHTVTLWGDTLAFMGAVFVVGYLVSGRILRKWMPIFLYAFPVTLIGALLLIPASYAVEDDFSAFGVFGWTSLDYFPWFLALALIAGLLGHTGLNTCLRYISPLVISTSVTLEPILGSFIGWAFFGSGVPGKWTWVGGPILVIGVMLVIYGGFKAEHANPQTDSPTPLS